MNLHEWGMSVSSIRGVVETAIQRASAATGVDFGFLLGAAKRESGYNPSAKASSSSAAGLFQFVDQTWLSTLKAHGAQHGYARYADLIVKGADGRYSVTGGDESRKAVMALKLDPHAAALMAGEMASDSAAYLRGRVGRTPTSGELYAAHFLGAQGSAKLIEAVQTAPAASASSLFPEAAAANPAVFRTGGRGATVSELYANLTRTGGEGTAVATPEASALPTADQGFQTYAAARTADRLEQQKALIDVILRGSQSVSGDTGSNVSSSVRLGGSLFSSEMLRVLSEASDKTVKR